VVGTDNTRALVILSRPVSVISSALLHCMRRLGNVAINRNAGGGTKILGDGAAGTKTTCFKEKVEAHLGISDCGFRIADFFTSAVLGLFEVSARANIKSEIRNPKFG